MTGKPTYEELERRVKALEREAYPRRKAEEALRQSEGKIRAILDQTFQFIGLLTTDGILIEANRASLQFAGLTEADVLGRPFWETPWWTHSRELQQELRLGIEKAAKGEVVFFHANHYDLEGAVHYIDGSIKPVRDGDGNVVFLIPEGHDVTIRKQAQERLHRINDCFLNFGSDINRNIDLLRELCGKLLEGDLARYDPREGIDKRISFGVFRDAGDEVLILNDLASHPQGRSDPDVSALCLRTCIGKNVKCGGEVVGTLCVFFKRDVLPSEDDKEVLEIAASAIGIEEDRKRADEEKERLEARLQRSKKMEAVGTLAGGVAHDLNNVLSGLVGYPALLLMDLPDDSPLRRAVLAIEDSGKRATAIVQDLLTLARRGVATTEVVNLNHLIESYMSSPEHDRLKAHFPDATFEVDLDESLMNVRGSSVHLSKSIMNLVSNAVESLSSGGRVAISTENEYIDRPVPGYDEVREGDYAVLTVADDGVGIADEDLEKIFEPFYTKKAMGRSGTGLGMAVVWGTVKDHDGYLDIESAEGRGTTFTLYLPVTRRELEEEGSVSIEAYRGHGERILVVDDVSQQRDIASALLTRLGYTVDLVSSGEEAVEFVRNQAVDLVVLDMIMDPGWDGLDTYRKILQERPEQKAVITSGFSETERVREAQRLGAGPYVKKPYTLEGIGLAVQTALRDQTRRPSTDSPWR
jgi:PAS domain S-box-containing protein